MDMINKIATVSPLTKENTGLLRCCGFLKDAYPRLRSDCKPSSSSDLEEKTILNGALTSFEQIKQEIVALNCSREEWSYLESLAESTWEPRGWSLGFWSPRYKGSEALYTPTEKEISPALRLLWQVESKSHGLNKLNGHIRGTAHRLRESHLCTPVYVCKYIYIGQVK